MTEQTNQTEPNTPAVTPVTNTLASADIITAVRLAMRARRNGFFTGSKDHVWIRGYAGGLTVRATDASTNDAREYTAVEVNIGSDVVLGGAMETPWLRLDGRKIIRAVQGFGAKTVDVTCGDAFSIEPPTAWGKVILRHIEIVDSTGDFKKPLEQVWPEFKRIDAPFGLALRELKRVAAEVGPYISSEATRYYLQGALIYTKDGACRAVATDGHALRDIRLGEAGSLLDGPKTKCLQSPVGPAFWIHKDALKIFASIKAKPETVVQFDLRDDAEPGDVGMCRASLCVLSGREDGNFWINVYSETMAAKFPDFRRVVPSESPAPVRVLRPWLDACRPLLVMADGLSPCVALSFGEQNGTPCLVAASSDRRDELSASVMLKLGNICRARPDIGKVGINAAYINRILSAGLKSAGDVEIHFGRKPAEDPILFRFTDDTLGYAVCMPMRL